MLFNELLLDVIGLVTGIAVFPQTSGKKIQRFWSILAIALSTLLLYGNMQWMYIFSGDIASRRMMVDLPLEHLSLWHIVGCVVFFQLYSLFPIASMRSGWLNTFKGLMLSIPSIVIACVGFCYALFGRWHTHLGSFNAILEHSGQQDVMVRLVLFAGSILAPTLVFLLPYFKGWISVGERPNRAMRFYLLSYGSVLIIYILLMLCTTGFIFNLFGYIVILPVLYINIAHLFGRSPFMASVTVVKEKEEIVAVKYVEDVQESPVLCELLASLQHFMEEEKPFVNPKCSMQVLLEALNTNENRLNKVLRSEGFSGFRDYINYHRLCYFKAQAAEHKDLTVKELMYVSGFTSRSSFYRYFGNMENMSPTEYLEELRRNSKEVYDMQG